MLIRLIVCAIFAIGLLALAGCDANGAAQGGGDGNAAHGRVKIGIPF
jgi:hypothetical protein